jgi:serine phosphatase RsbU (regulator of sigma subunit)
VYTDGPLFGVDFVSWPAPLRFELQPGQVLVVASDGLVEQQDPERQRFESQLACLQLEAGTDAAAALAQILAAFHAFRAGQDVRDDLTVLVVAPAGLG